ncbi:MAG TPA: CocE/NonD family hydrolase [Nevskiales bacterium]|nr:CocE/NonD family hydrolase [Nevskiales bacterium]
MKSRIAVAVMLFGCASLAWSLQARQSTLQDLLTVIGQGLAGLNAASATAAQQSVASAGDEDSDGVPDGTDQCLGTPAGQAVDANGCSSQQNSNASCARNRNLAGNRSYQVTLTAPDGEVNSFQVLEPTGFNCANAANGAHPLILHGPGYGGGRSTSGFAGERNAGYAVISVDPRGFGESGGTVRVMDPEFEGQRLLQILDWAEKNLDYLAWRNESDRSFMARPADATSVANGPNLVVGAMGGSYGGGYQLLILMVDAKKRLDAIQPDITWHDLRYSLNPGDVSKSLWDLALSAAGEASGQSSAGGPIEDGQDPFIKETLARGIATNEFPRTALDWFRYHSLGHWCAAAGLPSMPYPNYGPDAVPMLDVTDSNNVPPKQANGRPGFGQYLVQPVDAASHFQGLSVLLTQGMVDTLFNFNDAWWNYQCLAGAGAEVTLYTHNGGHTLPVAQSPDGTPAPAGSCPFNRVAWFDSKLKPAGGTPLPADEVCFIFGGNDRVTLPATEVLAPQPVRGLASGQMRRYTTRFLPEQLPSLGTPVPNGLFGAGSALGANPVVIPLGTAQAAGVLAGIPYLDMTVTTPGGLNELAQDCGDPMVPTVRLGCDSIIFVGLGLRTGSAATYKLIDDQVQPLRGLGRHRVDLVGVSERVPAGSQLALLVYGQHSQFFGGYSRDATIPTVLVKGSVKLPLYGLDNGQPDARLAGTVLADQAPPPPDRDEDGVPDAEDACPDEPGPAENDGCPLPPPDTTPDPFSFTSVSGVSKNTVVSSNVVTITGIDAPAPVSVSNGEYRIDGGAWTSVSGSITNGQTVQVRHTSASTANSVTETVLTIGGVSGKFRSTTAAGVDTDPDAFSFGSKTNVPVSTWVESDPVTPIGYDAQTTVKAGSGTEYSLGCTRDNWRSDQGTISPHTPICVRHMSASAPNTLRKTSLQIGRTVGYFTTRTAP